MSNNDFNLPCWISPVVKIFGTLIDNEAITSNRSSALKIVLLNEIFVLNTQAKCGIE